MSDVADIALTIASRLRHSEQGDWISRHDPADPEWCPPRMVLAFLRLGLVVNDDVEGGYLFTPLGLAVRAHLLENGQ